MHTRLRLQWLSQAAAFAACAVSIGAVTVGRRQIDCWRTYSSVVVDGGKAALGGEEQQRLLREVGEKMDISNDDLSRVFIFFTSHDNPIYHGCLTSLIGNWLKESWLPNGSIGLPLYYKNKYLDDTNYSTLMIEGKEFDIIPDSTEGIHLRRQMVLTEDAKKFVLARQLFYLKHNIDYMRDCFSIGAVYITYQIVFILNSSTAILTSVPAPARVLIYSLIAGVVYISKRVLMDAYLLNLHYKADRVAHLGSRYHTGAVEFYQKTINRNKLLYNLGFKKKFTKLGNEMSGILFNYRAVNNHVRLSKLMNPKVEK